MKSETLTRRERDEWWWVIHPRDARDMLASCLVAVGAWWVRAWPVALAASAVAIASPWRWHSQSGRQWLRIGWAYLVRPREMTIGPRSDVWWCRGERATRWRAVTRHGVSGENDELLAHSALRTLTQRGGQWRLHADYELTEWVSDHEGDYQAIWPLADRYRESWGALRRRDDVWVIGRIRSVDAGSDVWRALMATGHRLMIVMDLAIYSSRDARRDVTRLAHRAEVEERWRLRQGFESGRLSDRWMSVVQRRRDAVVSGDDLVEATVTVMVAATTRLDADRLFQDCVDVAAAHGALLDRGWGCQAPWFAESYGPVSHG